MTTDFCFDHVFRAPSTTAVLSAYFDPDHLATQDKVAELGDRVVVESIDDGAVWKATWRVSSHKQIPLIARPFVAGGRLTYLESMTWRRADEAVDLTVTPQILDGRVTMSAVYQLQKIGDNQIHRRYQGSVTVNIKLLSGKIEKAIVAELEKAMPSMAACTQGWLDRNPRP